MITTELLISCRKGNPAAQKQVYNYLGSRLYQTCKRYIKDDSDIEDVLTEAMYIIFTKIGQLKEPGAFEPWAKRITVNQCLQFLRKRVNFNLSIHDIKSEPRYDSHADDTIQYKELLGLLTRLPEGYTTIFNLHVIEGYSHKEIASLLSISEGTSKSQLNVAKSKLRMLINPAIRVKKNGKWGYQISIYSNSSEKPPKSRKRKDYSLSGSPYGKNSMINYSAKEKKCSWHVTPV